MVWCGPYLSKSYLQVVADLLTCGPVTAYMLVKTWTQHTTVQYRWWLYIRFHHPHLSTEMKHFYSSLAFPWVMPAVQLLATTASDRLKSMLCAEALERALLAKTNSPCGKQRESKIPKQIDATWHIAPATLCC